MRTAALTINQFRIDKRKWSREIVVVEFCGRSRVEKLPEAATFMNSSALL